MQELPSGSMLAVMLSETETRSLLRNGLALAAVNGAKSCVVSGTSAAIQELHDHLKQQDVYSQVLHTSHAFHSEMMEPILETFNDRVRQILILTILILMVVLSIKELKAFMPGLLGALTLYILSRASYFQLVFNRKWKRGSAALMYVFYYLLLLGLPIFLAIALVGPKVNSFLNDPEAMLNNLKLAIAKVQERVGFNLISESSLENFFSRMSEF